MAMGIREVVRLPIRNTVHVELTNLCNFDCGFCTNHLMTRERGMMDFDLFKKIINELSEEKISKRVDFHVMGEPLLYDKLIPAIEYVHSKNLKVCVYTNGSLLSKGLSAELSKLDFYMIVVSLQTPDIESFRVRRASIDFKKYTGQIVDFIKLMHASGSETRIRIAFLNTRLSRLVDVPCAVSGIDSKRKALEILKPWIETVYSIEGFPYDGTELDKALEKITLHRPLLIEVGQGRYSLDLPLLCDWGNAFSTSKIYPSRIGACFAIRELFGILWNGDLVLCCADFNGHTKMGNVASSSIMDILNSKRVLEIVQGFKRYRVVHPHCQKCLGGRSRAESLFRSIVSIAFVNFMRRNNVIRIPGP